MSRFYGDLRGNRGMATRCGSAKSGIDGHLRGWHVGARVSVFDVDGKDVVRVWRTGGSSGAASDKLIAEFSAEEGDGR